MAANNMDLQNKTNILINKQQKIIILIDTLINNLNNINMNISDKNSDEYKENLKLIYEHKRDLEKAEYDLVQYKTILLTLNTDILNINKIDTSISMDKNLLKKSTILNRNKIYNIETIKTLFTSQLKIYKNNE